jgi:hypothetical protein
VNLVPPVIRAWINAADGTEQVWELINGITPVGEGFLQPNDYDGSSPRFWAKASS